MAVANTKSTEIAGLDAAAPAFADRRLSHGRVRKKVGTVEVQAADDNGSVYRIARVHSSWAIHSIRVFNDAITGGTAFDVGLYETAAEGGAAVDDDAYASALDLSSGSTAGVEAAFESRNVDKVESKVWQDAGLAADPAMFYDLCVTGDTVGTAAGTISVVVQYTGD
jgi:hypothetical protein